MRSGKLVVLGAGLVATLAAGAGHAQSRRTVKPVLHGRHWVAITGKPLAATAGALIFAKGGNAVDAAAAMLAAACTMWDTLGWGGETQALVYDPRAKKVIGLNALGVAPTGATAEFYKERKLRYPPPTGPLAAVTPGTPGGLIVMLAEWGRLSLAEVLAPAILMADGYPIEAQLANGLERQKQVLSGWPYSKAVFLPHAGEAREAPSAGLVKNPAIISRTLATVEQATEVPQRSPGRGPPYWKSSVLRRPVLGDEEDGGGRGRGADEEVA
jgi:gamma-glutamyltranspeptidase/glutathione hydrolase